MRRAAATFLAIGAAIATGTLGCGNSGPLTCDRSAEGNPTIRYAEGEVKDGVYMSSPWDGELLYFPGGMHYGIEHKLGAAPRWINSYLSFDREGTRASSLAQAAGNQVVILDVSDTTVTLANDSCADYWLLVVAGSGAAPAP
ncbi:MAG: hypothetical protein ABJE95_23095 [Byssovorax sp.]